MMPSMAQKLTPRVFPCFRESGCDKITDASASTGVGPRSRVKKFRVESQGHV